MISRETRAKGKNAQNILKLLSQSKIYQDYAQAFNEGIGLPLEIRTIEACNIGLHGKPHENPFCKIMAQTNSGCAACLEVQQKLSLEGANETKSLTCFAGFYNSVIPIHNGKDLIGYLQIGQIALQKITQADFTRVTKQLREWGVQFDLKQLENSYFHTKVLSEKQYNALLRLLEIFAKHLLILANQIATQPNHTEPTIIKQAKEFIQRHKKTNISLGEVARSVNVSIFYFCKIFKKATGLSFTNYLSRIRVENAKKLLLDPHRQINSIALDVGFQSATHFNRIFRRITGNSPTAYRKNLSTI